MNSLIYDFIEFKKPKPKRGKYFREATPITEQYKQIVIKMNKLGIRNYHIVKLSHLHLTDKTIKNILSIKLK